MNPITRRGQVFLALAAKQKGYDLRNKENKVRKLRETEQLLAMFTRLLENHRTNQVLSSESYEGLRKKSAVLRREVEKKKKQLLGL